MKSATPDVPAESNDGQKKCNGRVLSTPFHVKKSIQAAAVATEPGGKEADNNVGSEDPEAENRRRKFRLDDGLHDIVVAFASQRLQDPRPTPVCCNEWPCDRIDPVGQRENCA
jgi:hypothetical protein